MKTADEILAIPQDQPERLFSGNLDQAKAEYRTLVQVWHPDRNHSVPSIVIAHINKLYEKAQEKLTAGIWQTPGLLRVTSIDGRVYQARYKHTRPFELGHVYIGERIVVYAIAKEFNDLVLNARILLKSLRYADDKMRAEAHRYLPQWEEQIDTTTYSYVVLLKGADYFCLRDILHYLGDKIDARNVAWIMSRLHALLCYFQWAGITHNDISLDNYYISPADHAGCLIGGWWYAAREGQKMLALPNRTLRLTPKNILDKKIAHRYIDSELIRAVGRELLGDSSGTGSKLLMHTDAPQPMLDWLRTPSSGRAVDDYDVWYNSILLKAFGKHQFVHMDAPSNLYKEEK